MPGSGGSTTTEVNKDPWAPAAPYLKDIMAQGSNLYASGTGSGVYNGPALSPQDPNTTQALGMMQNTAQNTDASFPARFGNQMMAGGGMSGAMQPALRTLGGVASGRTGIGTGGDYGDLANRAQGTNQDVIGGLGQIALGGNAPSASGLQNLEQSTQGQNYAPNWYMDNMASGNNGINTGGAYGAVAGAAGNPTNAESRYANPLASEQFDRGQFSGTANAALGPTNSERQLGGPSASEQFNRGEFQATANAKTDPTYAENFLGGFAGGQEANNPYLSQMLDANTRRIGDKVASQMSGSGRYGSGAHMDLLARSISEANSPIMAQEYEAMRNRQLQATGMMDTSRQASDATRLQALQGVLGASGQADQMRLANAGQMDTSRNQANATRLGALQGELGAMGQADQMRLGATGQQDQSRQAANATMLNAIQGLTGVQGQNISNQFNAAQGAANSRRADTGVSAGLLGQIANTQGQAIGNQINAGQTMAGLRNQNLQTELGALGGQTGVQQANIGNMTGAAGNMLNQYGQGLDRAATWGNMAPQNNALQYDPAQRLGQVGAYNEGRSQAELDQQKQIFAQQQQAPWTQLSRYGGAVSGLGQILAPAGQTNGQQQNTSSWADLFKLGGGVGALALPFLSDRNAKTDIQKLGENDPNTGLPLYAYRYKGDSKTYPKMVGPMAQDAAKVYPEKVRKLGGLLSIDADLMPLFPVPAGLLGKL